MRVAILILAHRQPCHLRKLVRALNCDWMHLFIHVDRKSADAENFFKIGGNNVMFLLDRINVYWSGYSSVRAILALLRAARESGQRYDRFCLLSGADFPVKNIDEIHDSPSPKSRPCRPNARASCPRPC